MGERFGDRTGAGEAGVYGVGDELGLLEGVDDSQSRDRVFVIAGVAQQRPAVAPRLPIEGGCRGGADESFFAAAGAHEVALAVRVEGAERVAFDVLAKLVEALAPTARPNEGETVIGREEHGDSALD